MSFTPKTEKERIKHRLKIARGHLDKVLDMVNDNVYCIDLLHQIQAVERGLKETEAVILKNHLNTCVAKAISEGKKHIVIAELMEVFRKKNA